MAVPKKKTSKAKRNMRRAHRMNLETGVYKGRQVLKTEESSDSE